MSDKDAAFPSPRYVVGVGLSKSTGNPAADRRVADQSAISEVLQQITANVSSDIVFEKIEVLGDKVQTSFQKTMQNSRVTSSVTINGLKIAKRYYDSDAKLFYSLAVLDRIEACGSLFQELRQYANDYQSQLAASQNEIASGEVNQSLLNLKAAMVSASKFEDLVPQFRILATSDMLADPLILNPPSLAMVVNRLTNYLSRITINIVSGNNQKFITGKPLPLPLTVKVVVDSVTRVPVPGLTVSFHFETGRGQITSQGITDSLGEASAMIQNVERAGVSSYVIIAKIGFQQLSDTARYAAEWNKRLPLGNKKVVFQVQRKRAKVPLKVLILLDQPSSAASKIAQSVLSQEFSEVGFNPVLPSDIGVSNTNSMVKAVQSAQFESLRTRFPGKFDLVVIGELSTSSLSNVEGLRIHIAKGSVKAFSVSTGTNLGADSFENVRGFGNSDEQANENAIRNGAADAAEKIIGDILSKY